MSCSLECEFQLHFGKVLQVSRLTKRTIRQYSCEGTPVAVVQCKDDGKSVAILESSRMLRIYSYSGDVTSLHMPTPAVAIFAFNTGLLIECHGDNIFPGLQTSAIVMYTLSFPFFALRPVEAPVASLSSRIKCTSGEYVITWSDKNNGELHLHRLTRMPLMDNGVPITSASPVSPRLSRSSARPSSRPKNRCSTPTNTSTERISLASISPSAYCPGSSPAADMTLVSLCSFPLQVSAQCSVMLWEVHDVVLVCDAGALQWFALNNLQVSLGCEANVCDVFATSIQAENCSLSCLSIKTNTGNYRLVLSPTIITSPLAKPRKTSYSISKAAYSLLQALLLLENTNELVATLVPVLVSTYQDVGPVAALPCLVLLLHGSEDISNDLQSVFSSVNVRWNAAQNDEQWRYHAAHLKHYVEQTAYLSISMKNLLADMLLAILLNGLVHGAVQSQEYEAMFAAFVFMDFSIDDSVTKLTISITHAIRAPDSIQNGFDVALLQIVCPTLCDVIPKMNVDSVQNSLAPSLSIIQRILGKISMDESKTRFSVGLSAAFIDVLNTSKLNLEQVLSVLPLAFRAVFAMALLQARDEDVEGKMLLTWPYDLLQYIGREDIALNLKPPSISPTSSTAADIDGLKNCESIGGEMFPSDERMLEVCRMLRSTSPLYLRVERPPEMTDAAHRLKLQQRLLSLVRRSLASAVGRGMVTLASHHALVAESLPIPLLCLSGRVPPSNAVVNLDTSAATQDLLAWPEFHNGVAVGMRVRGSVTRNWILYNKTLATTAATAAETSPALTAHAGSLLALGLRGHLGVLTASDICDYLTMNYDSATIAILLGCAASKIGSCDTLLSKSLCLHLPSLVYNQASELSIPHLVQCTSIIGLGLLHCGSGGRLLVEFLLKEITRRGDECHDGIILVSGMALGLLLLGYGQEGDKARKFEQLSDLSIEDRLQRCITGGDRGSDLYDPYKQPSTRSMESNSININATAPAAIIALSLMYLKSDNTAVAARLALPQTAYEIDTIRPDMFLYLAMGYCLVKWSTVAATEEWLLSLMPKLIKYVLFGGPTIMSGKAASISRRTALQSFLCILSGACWGLALVFAGTSDAKVRALLMKQLRLLQSLRDGTNPPPSTYAMWQQGPASPVFLKAITDKASRSVVELCVIQISVSLGMVCAGSGDVDVLRQLRVLRWKVEDVSYGAHMGIGMAIGLLFLGSGRMSLKRDNISIASLLISTCPRYPSRSQDNSIHLQPLRHMYALAVEERCLICKDAITGNSQRIMVEIRLFSGSVEVRETPCLLPELSYVESIVSQSDAHHVTVLPISAASPKPLVLYVRKKATSMPSALEQRLRADLLQLRSRLVEEDSYHTLVKKCESSVVAEWAMAPLLRGQSSDVLLEIALFS